MLPIAFTAAAVAMAAVAAPAQADMVRDCLCVLSRHDHSIPREEFRCDWTQTHAASYIDSKRWRFVFPHAEQNKTFSRRNTEDFIRWAREGQYILTLYQRGVKPFEHGEV